MDGVWLFPFAPFLFVLGIIWLSNQRKLEEKRIAAGETGPGKPDPQQAKQIAELQERVRVLERIVTEGGYDLASQIEALRDERPVDRLASSRDDKTLERLR